MCKNYSVIILKKKRIIKGEEERGSYMDILSEGVTREIYQNLYIGSELEMMWHCRSDPRFSYHTYVPGSVYDQKVPRFRIMSFVHGTGRTMERYRSLFSDFADRNHLILIFPMFPGGLMERDNFNSYKLLADQGIRYDSIFLSMIDEMAQRFPVDKEKIFLYGWSGGAQFAHRFLYVHPERLAGVAVGAPGRITYLDPETDYYWGTRNFREIFDKELDLEQIKRVPVKLMVGEHDTRFLGESPRGNNRMERIRNLMKNYQEHQIPVSLEVIPGIEHKGFDEKKAPIVMRFFQEILEKEKAVRGKEETV